MQGRLHPGGRGVPVPGLERLDERAVLLEPGVEVAGVAPELLLDGAHPRFEPPQLGQGVVDGALHGAVERKIRRLRQIPEAAGGLYEHLPAVGRVDPGDHAQQRRLPGTVLSDHPDPLTQSDGHPDPVQHGGPSGRGRPYDIGQRDLKGPSGLRGLNGV